MDLIHRTKSILDSIQNLTERSREKFADRESGEDFCKSITDDIQKIELLLNGFLNYIKSTTPVIKKDTVNTLVEEVMKTHRIRLEERKIRIHNNLEKELPETIVSDEQMIFILDSVLQYATSSLSSGGAIEILTRSFDHQVQTGEGQSFLRERGKRVEIAFTFTDYQNRSEQPVKAYEGLSLPQKERALDLLLRLVLAVVERNQGTMQFETDGAKEKRSLVLKLPAERRRSVHYQLIDEQYPAFDRSPLRHNM
ncbi:MAG: hypothetical protein ABSA46_18760 [Thermodesulfovibrionales bacterium]|jgi:hypothetical protein